MTQVELKEPPTEVGGIRLYARSLRWWDYENRETRARRLILIFFLEGDALTTSVSTDPLRFVALQNLRSTL